MSDCQYYFGQHNDVGGRNDEGKDRMRGRLTLDMTNGDAISMVI